MALVPYIPPRYNASMMMPYMPRTPLAVQAPIRRTYNNNRQNTRRRSKWANYNTTTSPVYPRPEVKFQDYPIGSLIAPATIPNDGSFNYCINPLAQGTGGLSQRIGQQVATKSCYFQMVVNLGATPVPIVIRHILYWDRQYNGATNPSVSELLANNSYVSSPLNLANRNRFVVLADDRITLSPQGEMIRLVDGFRNINQLSTYPEATFQPLTGALCLLMVSDHPTGATAPTMYGIWRTRYMDN